MSDEESSTGDDQVGRIDDPDWVDQIVARALAKAEGAVRAAALDADTKAEPGTRSRSVSEVAADAATIDGEPATTPATLAGEPAATSAATLAGEPATTPATPAFSPAAARSVPPPPTATRPAPVAEPSRPPDTPATEGSGDRAAAGVAATAADELAPPDATADDASATAADELAPPDAVDASATGATELAPPDLATDRLAAEAGPATATATADEPVGDQLLVADDESRPVDADHSEATESDGEDDESGGAMRSIVEWGAVIVGALVVAFLIKTFLLQAFFIPSGSMEPTLNIGDRVLVNKLAYDFHDVNRGDLVVFDRPSAEAGGVPDLIKRVIALSGETIQFRDGLIYVDNRRLDEPYQPPGAPTSGLSLTNAGATLCGAADVCTVPEGYVFVMGDNRNDSRDSRFFGPIPEDAIVGRAFLRVWPLDSIEFL